MVGPGLGWHKDKPGSAVWWGCLFLCLRACFVCECVSVGPAGGLELNCRCDGTNARQSVNRRATSKKI